MPSHTAAKAMRESFGDRKLPDISRRITACVTCRKLKIKCHMSSSRTTCTRCKARGLSCQVNKSLQALLEDDASWKEDIEQRISRIERDLQQDDPEKGDTTTTNIDLECHQANADRHVITDTQIRNDPLEQRRESDQSIELNLSMDLGAFPGSSIAKPIAVDERDASAYRPDLISSGAIALSAAQDCFNFYKQNLDPCIHYVLEDNNTLASIRAKSTLLTAAICTTAAFCMGSGDYPACHKAFTEEISRKMFASKYDFDDVRGLCIGAFWLGDISSAANGLAVRIGTQLDLHRCITKMPHTKKDCYDRTRWYFLVYLCDHHSSLIYGRPPMTREWRSLKEPGLFLQSEFSNRSDLSLMSQVDLWSISSQVFESFGADVESTLANQKCSEVERLLDAYDRWFEDWSSVLGLKDEIGTFHRFRFDLYYHCGKLYLLSHVFRGSANGDATSTFQSTQGLASQAFQSSLAITACVTDSSEEHTWLTKLPFYFYTMIAFACVYLARSISQPGLIDDARKSEAFCNLHRLCKTLRSTSDQYFSHHPLASIAKSLEAVTFGEAPIEGESFDMPSEDDFRNMIFDFDAFGADTLNWNFLTQDTWGLCPDDMETSNF